MVNRDARLSTATRLKTKVVAGRHVADDGDGAERGHDRRPHAVENRDADILAEPVPGGPHFRALPMKVAMTCLAKLFCCAMSAVIGVESVISCPLYALGDWFT